jgi:sterol 3beta-glucosyltransferase
VKVAILTYGSRGDVEPFVALARGFLQSGHSVQLAAPEAFAEFVGSHGVECVSLPGDPDRLVAAMVDQAGPSWARMVMVMSRFILPLAVEVLERVQHAADGADAVIHSFLMTQAGHEVALRQGIPDISAQLFPVFAVTSAFPGVVFPDLPFGPAYRRLTHIVINQTFHLGGRFLYSRVRHDRPWLPKLSRWPFAGRPPHNTPILFGFSPCVIPRPGDWPESVQMTGYWFLEPGGEDGTDAALRRFIDAGPAPVYVGFGSMIAGDRDRLATATIDALEMTGGRAVMASGQGGVRPAIARDFVHVIESVPHRWLFPRMSAIVHHGGAGTTGAGFRAGVPQVIVPFTADQHFWGRRVRSLGGGPSPIPLSRLTAQRLSEAIAQATSDSELRARAQKIGRQVAAEDGVGTAVRFVVQHTKEFAASASGAAVKTGRER